MGPRPSVELWWWAPAAGDEGRGSCGVSWGFPHSGGGSHTGPQGPGRAGGALW